MCNDFSFDWCVTELIYGAFFGYYICVVCVKFNIFVRNFFFRINLFAMIYFLVKFVFFMLMLMCVIYLVLFI